MSKIGISSGIDVTKIDKSRLFKGKKGTYLDISASINLSEVDQYGNNGMVTQSVSSEERAKGVKEVILGNSKIFWTDGNDSPKEQSPTGTGFDDMKDDIPF
jgi:hypothetical protein